MRRLKLNRAFTLIEPGPVVLVTTHDGGKNNVMTISWTRVVDFTPLFAITTGEWNHAFAAPRKNQECVVAVPTVDLLDKVVGIGTCSGADTDKFAAFKLTPVRGNFVKAPLIEECLANIECKVIDIVGRHNIVVLEGLAAYMDSARKERRMVDAVGDGRFIVDGCKLDRRNMMAAKIPEGVWRLSASHDAVFRSPRRQSLAAVSVRRGWHRRWQHACCTATGGRRVGAGATA